MARVPIDTTQPGSPGWWLERLGRQLHIERNGTTEKAGLDKLWRYYEGRCDLPEGAEGCRDAYLAFQRKARGNFAELVTDAVGDRMTLTGFRTGAEGDENGDLEARRLWKANGLRVGSTDLHTWMLAMGKAYAIVGGPSEETSGYPVVTVEDPRQVITAHDPRLPGRVRMALKLFVDEWTGRDVAYLYQPDGWVLVAERKSNDGNPLHFATSPTFAADGWEWATARFGQLPVKAMPVVRFRNKGGMGEFEPHLDVLDRINFVVLQRLVIAAIQAFKQRGVIGDLPDTDDEGNDIDYSAIFRPGPGALWKLPEGASIWESGQVDLNGILKAAEDDIKHLAAVTRTPLYFISPDAANGSAEGASTQREGLVFKSEDRINRAADSWAQLMSLAFRFKGDEARARLLDLEAVFAPAERHSLAERADAASKLNGVMPWRHLMADVMGFPPDMVREMAAERTSDLLLSTLAEPVTPAAPPVTDVRPA